MSNILVRIGKIKISKEAKMILEMKSKKGGVSQSELLEYAILNTNIKKK